MSFSRRSMQGDAPQDKSATMDGSAIEYPGWTDTPLFYPGSQDFPSYPQLTPGENSSSLASYQYNHYDPYLQYPRSPGPISPMLTTSTSSVYPDLLGGANTNETYLSGTSPTETNPFPMNQWNAEQGFAPLVRPDTRSDASFHSDIRIDTSVRSIPMSPSTSSSKTPESNNLSRHWLPPSVAFGQVYSESVKPEHESNTDSSVMSPPHSPRANISNQSHQYQMKLFKDIPATVVVSTTIPRGSFIPQKMYRPHTVADKRRYVEEIQLEEPIVFYTEKPAECGISLSDALRSNVKRLLSRDDTVFKNRGPSVSIRLEWPGYGSWSRQIPTKDFKSPPGPITVQKLAKNISKNVQRFIEDVEKKHLPFDEDTDGKWRVGPRHIKFEDLILVSLHHVSMGSWQPHLRLKNPVPRI